MDKSLKKTFGRNESLHEPRTGGVVSGESATGNGLQPANRPLALESAPKEAQTI